MMCSFRIGENLKNLVKTIELNMPKIISAYAFAPIGGGDLLWARVLGGIL